MSLRQGGTAFRVQQGGSVSDATNIIEGSQSYTNVAYQSLWSPGATILDSVSLAPSISERWSILSIGIQGFIIISASRPLYGKLGKLIGGVVLHGSTPSQNPASPNLPYTSSLQPLPKDPSLTTDLWNPATDPLPPNLTGSNRTLPAGLPFAGVIQFPIPIPIRSEFQALVGMWMLPSLIGSSVGVNGAQMSIIISGSSYAINYEDGHER